METPENITMISPEPGIYRLPTGKNRKKLAKRRVLPATATNARPSARPSRKKDPPNVTELW
jgi:hypothetical protein